MRKFTLPKLNGSRIACSIELPASSADNTAPVFEEEPVVVCTEDQKVPGTIVIAIHGFTSSKESPTVRMLQRRLPAAGIGVIGIDLPAHGTEESSLEELRIEACKDSIAAAEEYAAREFPEAEICYFASSFGAYITGLYLSSRPHRGRKAFFRSAAVNMPSLFILEESDPKYQEYMRDLAEKGFIQPSLDLGSPVKVTKAMLDDLAQNDLFEKFAPECFEDLWTGTARDASGLSAEHRIEMAHGASDDVIDPDAARRFADRFGLKVTFFEGEGHSLSNDPGTPDKVADLAISLYLGN